MNIKRLILSGLATTIIGTVSLPMVMKQDAEAATYGAYEYRNYDLTAKENLENLLKASDSYKEWAKDSGQRYYQQKLTQAIFLGKKQLKSNQPEQMNTAINRLSESYNEVFQIHLAQHKESDMIAKQHSELKQLIAQADVLLKESHLSMNQDESQLKLTLAEANKLVNRSLDSVELENSIAALKHGIDKVESYKKFVNHQ